MEHPLKGSRLVVLAAGIFTLGTITWAAPAQTRTFAWSVATPGTAQATAQAPVQGTSSTATGQQGAARGAAPQAAPQNLQVLPKDTPRDQIQATMRAFTQALGVQCNYCHVQEGRGGRNDMAADEKQPKKTARVMMRMTTHVNEMLASDLGKPAADIAKVQCATCHRGSAIPKVDPPAATPAPAQAAPAAPGAR
jgi:hypothetical protein